MQRNAGRRQRLAEELAVMRELPARRMESAKRERVKVDSGSLIHVERNSYSVNSRLIGERVEARSYLDHIEVWYGQRKVEDSAAAARAEPSIGSITGTSSSGWCGSRERLRTTAIKRICFRPAGFGWLTMHCGKRRQAEPCKEYLKILKLAAEEGETTWMRLCGNCWKEGGSRRSRWNRSANCCSQARYALRR